MIVNNPFLDFFDKGRNGTNVLILISTEKALQKLIFILFVFYNFAGLPQMDHKATAGSVSLLQNIFSNFRFLLMKQIELMYSQIRILDDLQLCTIFKRGILNLADSFYQSTRTFLCAIFLLLVVTCNVMFVFPLLCCHEVDVVLQSMSCSLQIVISMSFACRSQQLLLLNAIWLSKN